MAYTTTQAAKLIGCSTDAVKLWIRKGKIKAYKTPGGHFRISSGVLYSFMKDTGMEIPHALAGEARSSPVLEPAARPDVDLDYFRARGSELAVLEMPVYDRLKSLAGKTPGKKRARAEKEKLSPVIVEGMKILFGSIDDENLFYIQLVKVASIIADCGRVSLMLRTGQLLHIASCVGMDGRLRKEEFVQVGERISGKVALTGEALLVKNAGKEKVTKNVRIGGKQFTSDSFMTVPIVFEKETLGVMNLTNPVKRARFNDNDFKLVREFCKSTAPLAAKVREIGRIITGSQVDPLTGLFSRKRLPVVLDMEVERARRYGGDLSLALLYIDDLGRLNMKYGDEIGDVVVKSVARTIIKNTRKLDYKLSYRNGSIILVLPHTPKDGALVCAERLRKVILGTVHGNLNLGSPVSVSAGVESFRRTNGTDNHGVLVETCEELAREASRMGGNRTVSN